jgi:plastocyanin
VTRQVTARALLFSPTIIAAPAGSSVTLVMDNVDVLVPHDIGLDANRTTTCPGPCKPAITFTAPPRGTYKLTCTLHPDMTVTLQTQ